MADWEKRFSLAGRKALVTGASKGIGFEDRDIEVPLWFESLNMLYPEARQMPQIFINNQRVGGLAGLQNALKELGL